MDKKEKKIPRLLARTCIILLVASLLTISFGAYAKMPVVQYVGLGVLLISLAIRQFGIRCPHCGCTANFPQWSKSGTMRCKACGEPLEYDK